MRILYLMSSSMTTYGKRTLSKNSSRVRFLRLLEILVVYRNKDRDRAMGARKRREIVLLGGHFQVLFGDGGIRL